jgi:hypothetical protein
MPSISNRKLVDFINRIKDNPSSKNNIAQELKHLIVFEIINERMISMIGWEFDVTVWIYSSANSSEVKSGFDFLMNSNIHLETYLNAFLIKSIDDAFNQERTKAKEYHDTTIDITSEPEVLELLRLCYWINRCKNIIGNSFNNKFNEVKEQLELGYKDELAKGFADSCNRISKKLLDYVHSYSERESHATHFLNELNKFRTTVSSFVSEFMLAAISREEGFDVEFPLKSDSEKTCDITLDSFDVEVKTILDRIEFSNTEETLSKELEGTLKKKKVVESINDALSKHPDVIFLVLTFTSAGISINDHILQSQNHQPSIQQMLRQAIALSSSNRALRKSQQTNEIPVVIFVAGVDVTNSIYRVSALTIRHPLLTINNYLIADSEKLKIDL